MATSDGTSQPRSGGSRRSGSSCSTARGGRCSRRAASRPRTTAASASRPLARRPGDPDLLNLTRPGRRARRSTSAYFAAGADITTTNTFTATSIGQADYGLEDAVYEMNVAGARIAREAAGRPLRRGLGRAAQRHALAQPARRRPGYRTHTFDQVEDAYAEQIRGARRRRRRPAAARDDLRHAEREGRDRRRARDGAASCRSGSRRHDRRPLGPHALGQTIEAFWTSIEHADPLIVGVNCSLGAKEMRPYVAELVARRAVPRLVRTRTPACRTRSAATTRRPR